MSYGVKFRNRHQTRISQSFAKRVEESKEEDEEDMSSSPRWDLKALSDYHKEADDGKKT